MKKRISIILIFFLFGILSLQNSASAYTTDLGTINTEYTDEYIEYMKLSDEEKANVIMPRIYKTYESTESAEEILSDEFSLYGAEKLEERFSLQDIIPENIAVRDQGSTNSCWAFSSLSALEINLAMQNKNSGRIAKTYNFSELHMEYSCLSFFKNNKTKSPYGYYRTLGAGGNFYMASSYLMSGEGAVDETSLPYTDYTQIKGYKPSANPEDVNIIDISNITNKTVTARVYDTLEFPSASTDEDIENLKTIMKKFIKTYGAIDTGIYTSDGNSYGQNGALYSSSKSAANHEIVIIGWDDNYAVSNFNVNEMPSNPGAWIIKNSWGTDYGDNGIFYVSYEDKHIYLSANAIKKSSDTIDYDEIYQYDYLYPIGTLSNGSVSFVTIGEEFTKSTSKIELLNEISLFVPTSLKNKYEVYVGKDKDNLNLVTLEGGKTSETFNEMGYHTIEFENPVKILTDTFFVAVKIYGDVSDTVVVSLEMSAENTVWENVEIESNKCFLKRAYTYNNFSTDWADLHELR
jgi:C1A family cysteine protease